MVSVFYQNCCGLRTKSSIFYPNLLGCTYDIICLSETWFNENIVNCNYFTNEYLVFRKDRARPNPDVDIRGGGTVIAVKKHLKVFRRYDLDFNNIECTWVEIKLRDDFKLLIGNHYFPPTIRTDLLQNYVNFLEAANIDSVSTKLLLVGDYNLPKFNWELGVSGNENSYIGNKSDIVYSLLNSFNLVQNNFQRILDTDNILDLVCSNFSDLLTVNKERGLVRWDHEHPGLLIDIQLPVYHVNFTPLVKLDYAKGDYLGLYTYLSNFEFIDTDDPNALVKNLTVAVQSAIKNFIPEKVVYPSKYPHWFSRKLIHLLHLKEKFHSKFKKNPNNSYFKEQFSKFRKLSKSVFKTDKFRFKCKVESDLKYNPKFFWQFIKTQYKNSHELSIIVNGEPVPVERTPELFAHHFSSIYASRNIDSINYAKAYLMQCNSNSIQPCKISVSDVIKAGKSLKSSRVAGSDKIPSFIVKGSIMLLAPILCKIFNLCLDVGVFPTAWKTSIVVPVPKGGNVNSVKNYRPISLLTNFSKLFERIVFNHLIFNIKCQLSPNQHGFLSGRSTVTNLVSFLQYTAPAVLDRNQVDTAYFDLSKAFDVVDHNLLNIKLKKIGLSPLYVNFLESYLFERFFCVKVGNFLSFEHCIPCGVPQGSILGPLLFIIFFDDIKSVISGHFDIFADDLKVSRIIHDPEDVNALQLDIDSVLLWCSANGMLCNSDKTVIVSYSRKHSVYYNSYTINNNVISRKHIHKDLGIFLDNKLNFDHQIHKALNNARRSSGVVYWATKSFREISTVSVLFSSLVRSRLEYCSEVWGGVGQTDIRRIEQIQKSFLRKVVFRSTGQFEPYYTSLATFKLATLESRRIFKDICFIYKLVNYYIDCTLLLAKLRFKVPTFRSRHYRPFNAQALTLVPLNRLMCKCNEYPELDFSQNLGSFITALQAILYLNG